MKNIKSSVKRLMFDALQKQFVTGQLMRYIDMCHMFNVWNNFAWDQLMKYINSSVTCLMFETYVTEIN